jgi:simple sugar transport system permease protein
MSMHARWGGSDLYYRLRSSSIAIVVVFIVAQVASVTYGALDPSRFAYNYSVNISTALNTGALLGIVSLGVGILMLTGEFDLSVGANYIFSSAVMVGLWQNEKLPIFVAAVVAILLGGAIGLLNGILTLGLHLPSFITTLGTMGIWEAAVLYYHGATPITFTPSRAFEVVTAGSFGVVPADFVWFVAIGLVCWWLYHRTTVGNHIAATGGNAAAALAVGVRVGRVKILAFVISGACAATAGVLAASLLGSIQAGGAEDVPLNAIAACVVGGLALTGGTGGIAGVAVGAFFIYWIQDVLLLVGAPGFYLSGFVGALIIGAVAFHQVVQRRGGAGSRSRGAR